MKYRIGEGNAGNQVTLARLTTQLRIPSRLVRKTAEDILRQDPEHGPIGAFWAWVRAHVEYLPDDARSEELRSPEYLILTIGETGQAFGDCDDLVGLLASLLLSVGYSVRLVAISLSPDQVWSHLYLQVKDLETGTWIPLDPIVPEARPGWEVSSIEVTARQVFPV